MSTFLSRREFLKHSAMTAAGFWIGAGTARAARKLSANEKLNIAVVGVAHRGGANLAGVEDENIVALCDVDDKLLAAAAQKHPSAKTFNDFRRMLGMKGIDAVVVSTADHTHAVAAVAALRSGRHVYCEKPLTRTVSECRIVRETARKTRLATQLGTQIHAGANYRRVVELVKGGAIGGAGEVHVWCAATYGGKDAPTDTPPVPPELHYDLWLGPVPPRPYHPDYLPGRWRNWWAFGQGALGDFGCHYMDLPHWALDLRHVLAVEAEGPPVHPESTPPWAIVRYDYPARGAQRPVKLTWYHGGKKPELLASLLAEQEPPAQPQGKQGKKSRPAWNSGVLFVGEKGWLLADYGNHVLLPEKKFADFVRPAPTIPDSVGHHQEWINACKAGGATTCNFDYSGALAETVLLGNVAYRVGERLTWDSKRLRAVNCPKADRFVQHQYRKGWKL